MDRNFVGIVEKLHKGMPLLMVDLDNETIQEHDKRLIVEAGNILNRIAKHSVYITCNYESEEYYRFKEMTCIKLPYWHKEKEAFIEQVKKIPGDVIQLGGIYQELCVLKVASIIVQNTDKQVIIVNELCAKSRDDISDTAIEFNVEVQWLGEIFMSQNCKEEASISINSNGQIDLSNIPLHVLAAEVNKRKRDRIPELIKEMNNIISELKDLNCPIINCQDERFEVAEIYMEDEKVYLSEVSED